MWPNSTDDLVLTEEERDFRDRGIGGVGAMHRIRLNGFGVFGADRPGRRRLRPIVGLTAAYYSDWSLLSMYLLLLAVVTFRARGLMGKASVLER